MSNGRTGAVTFHRLRLPLTAAILSLIVYLRTTAPDLTWSHFGGDGGELITAAVTLGVPHPPGYPTYVLLGHLVHYLPLGSAAWRFHLLSAVAAAAAAGVVTATAGRWPDKGRQPAALATGLTFAWMPLVWSQAIIAEVYGLNLLLGALLLWLLLTKNRPVISGLVLGLSVTTHLTSALLLLPALALTPRRGWPQLLLGAGAGLTPFLALFWLASSDSVVQWGAPQSLSGWWWLVSGALYRPNVLGLTTAEAALRLRQWLPQLLAQLAGGGWLLLPLAAWQLRGRARRQAQVLAATAAAFFVYAMTYSSADAIVFALPGLLLLSILLTPAMRRIGWAALLLPALLLALNFRVLDLHQETGPAPAAEQLLADAPADAILITPGDQTIFTLWYVQQVNGSRPDLLLVDANLLALDWYRRHLQVREPALLDLDEDNVDAFLTANRQQRPVCQAFLTPAAALDCAATRRLPGPA